jgi:hypothetical protein
MSVITVNKLVLDAFFLTDQWDVTRMPTEGDMSRALGLLTYIIQASPSVDIPFKSEFSWTLEVGKGAYTFGDDSQDFESERIQRLDFCYLTQDQVTYPLVVIQPIEYYQSTRVNSMESRPQAVMLENRIGISTVTLYPKPNQAYLFTMQYIKDLPDFTAQVPIDNIPRYYLS